jgi:SAM-dependent methyltransferase
MENHFDGLVAEHYDETSAAMFEPALLERTVGFLADHARGGTALEFALGTGRIALPLAALGVTVEGIEFSPAMVGQFRRKPGSEHIPVTIGDMSTTRLGRRFSLVYLVWNTISNLTTQDAQVACFQNAADHLQPGGRFVIELWIPELRRLLPGEHRVLCEVSDDHVGFDEIDTAAQTGTSHHYFTVDGNTRHETTPFRYAWPAELDLMARIAGLTLVERWAGWDCSPFTSDSTSHVSVWEKPVTQNLGSVELHAVADDEGAGRLVVNGLATGVDERPHVHGHLEEHAHAGDDPEGGGHE